MPLKPKYEDDSLFSRITFLTPQVKPEAQSELKLLPSDPFPRADLQALDRNATSEFGWLMPGLHERLKALMNSGDPALQELVDPLYARSQEEFSPTMRHFSPGDLYGMDFHERQMLQNWLGPLE